MYVVSSGEKPLETINTDPITLIAATVTRIYTCIRIVNTGTVAGLYSYDGGTTWHYLPASTAIEDLDLALVNKVLQVKRLSTGSNVSGLYASAG